MTGMTKIYLLASLVWVCCLPSNARIGERRTDLEHRMGKPESIELSKIVEEGVDLTYKLEKLGEVRYSFTGRGRNDVVLVVTIIPKGRLVSTKIKEIGVSLIPFSSVKRLKQERLLKHGMSEYYYTVTNSFADGIPQGAIYYDGKKLIVGRNPQCIPDIRDRLDTRNKGADAL